MKTNELINRENVLLTLDGFYNYEIHDKLDKAIRGIAGNKIKTNPLMNFDDLCQDAWLRILDVVDNNLKKGKELEYKYLYVVAQSIILGMCKVQAKKNVHIDHYKSGIFNNNDRFSNIGDSGLGKNAKLELEILESSGMNNVSDNIILQVALEEVIDNITDDLVKNFIILKYIKEFDGTSPHILELYINFFNSLNYELQDTLINCKKFTNALAFKCLGLRATDNKSTYIRNEVKKVLTILL